MSASQLAPTLRHVAWALMFLGLYLAEFWGVRALGHLVAICGVAAMGGWAAAAYLHWENGE